MNFKIVKNTFWAMRYMFISLGFLVWGMTIDIWEVSNFVGYIGILLFLGGWVVFEMETIKK